MPVWKTHYITRLLINLFILFAFYGCYSSPSNSNPVNNEAITSEANPMQLEIKNGWRLEQLTNNKGKLVAALQNPPITLFFSGDSKLNGKSGCNNYFAGYRLSGQKLSIDKGGSTMMACPEAIMAQEQHYMQLLAQVTTYQISHEQLHLLDASSNVILVFLAHQPTSLTDETWQLQSYNTGNALLSNATTALITADFSADGKLSGFAGCNRYTSTFTINGEKLELTPIATTRKLCRSTDVMETENDYLTLLADADHYAILENKLTLYNAANKRIVIFKLNR